MSEPIKIVVTRERFNEVVSIDDGMYFLQLNDREAYDYMCQFIMNGDNKYLSVEEARKKFKKIPRTEFPGYIQTFMKAVSDAFVNPPNGLDSGGQSKPE